MSLDEEIISLKKENNAVVLAHNYVRGDIQDIADYTGDSFGLSCKAVEAKADVIVFCGVDFMAESAAILNPEKTVLNPRPEAGCPMANTITAADVRWLKKKYPEAAVVCYVNSSAAVKAESDVCCTSANAVKVVNALDKDEVIFVPDMNLALYTQRFTEKKIIPWHGFCPTHHQISGLDVLSAKKERPGAAVIVHPECRPEVIDMADGVFSTEGMLRFAKETDRDVIVGTEMGILHRLKNENQGKGFYPVSPHVVCPNMKIINLESVRDSLRDMRTVITIPEDIRINAKKALDRMLETGR